MGYTVRGNEEALKSVGISLDFANQIATAFWTLNGPYEAPFACVELEMPPEALKDHSLNQFEHRLPLGTVWIFPKHDLGEFLEFLDAGAGQHIKDLTRDADLVISIHRGNTFTILPLKGKQVTTTCAVQ